MFEGSPRQVASSRDPRLFNQRVRGDLRPSVASACDIDTSTSPSWEEVDGDETNNRIESPNHNPSHASNLRSHENGATASSSHSDMMDTGYDKELDKALRIVGKFGVAKKVDFDFCLSLERRRVSNLGSRVESYVSGLNAMDVLDMETNVNGVVAIAKNAPEFPYFLERRDLSLEELRMMAYNDMNVGLLLDSSEKELFLKGPIMIYTHSESAEEWRHYSQSTNPTLPVASTTRIDNVLNPMPHIGIS